MNRLVLTVALAGSVVLGACGGGEVVVQGAIEGADGQPVPLREMAFQLLPYDRDAIFDSLAAAYPEAEPEIPTALAALRDSIAAAQTATSVATARWSTARDSLQKLSQAMQGLNRTSGQYIALFNEYNALEAQHNAAQREMDQQFQRQQSMTTRYAAQAQEIRLAREQWGDAAYNDVDRVIAVRLRELRRDPKADTLDANGVARVRGLAAGEWWITAHYDLPYEELYWNVPVTVVRGEPAQVQLTRQTAVVRPKL